MREETYITETIDESIDFVIKLTPTDVQNITKSGLIDIIQEMTHTLILLKEEIEKINKKMEEK